MSMFQQPTRKQVNRADHVWYKRPDGTYKCCLCGGVTLLPPHYPTPDDWLPERYEVVEEADRLLSPPH